MNAYIYSIPKHIMPFINIDNLDSLFEWLKWDAVKDDLDENGNENRNGNGNGNENESDESIERKARKNILILRDKLIVLYFIHPELFDNKKLHQWQMDLFGYKALGEIDWNTTYINYRDMGNEYLDILKKLNENGNDKKLTKEAEDFKHERDSLIEILENLVKKDCNANGWNFKMRFGNRRISESRENATVRHGKKLHSFTFSTLPEKQKDDPIMVDKLRDLTLNFVMRLKLIEVLPGVGILYSVRTHKHAGAECENFGFYEKMLFSVILECMTKLYNIRVTQWEMDDTSIQMVVFIPCNKLTEQEARERSMSIFFRRKRSRVLSPENLNDLSHFMNHLQTNFTLQWFWYTKRKIGGSIFYHKRFQFIIQDPQTLDTFLTSEALECTCYNLEQLGIDSRPAPDEVYLTKYACGRNNFVEQVGGCSGRNGKKRIDREGLMAWAIRRDKKDYPKDPEHPMGELLMNTLDFITGGSKIIRSRMLPYDANLATSAYMFDATYRWCRVKPSEIEKYNDFLKKRRDSLKKPTDSLKKPTDSLKKLTDSLKKDIDSLTKDIDSLTNDTD